MKLKKVHLNVQSWSMFCPFNKQCVTFCQLVVVASLEALGSFQEVGHPLFRQVS